MIVVSIFDRVSSEYSTPYTFINIDDAKRRLFQAYVNNPFQNDLEVYSIGSFDCFKGGLVGHDKEFLFNISALIAEVKSNV